MSNDSESRKKPASGAVWLGRAAAVLGILTLALYIVYVVLSFGEPSDRGFGLRVLMQLFSVAAVVTGIAALCLRRWICGLIAILCPVLLPILDWIVRAAR